MRRDDVAFFYLSPPAISVLKEHPASPFRNKGVMPTKLKILVVSSLVSLVLIGPLNATTATTSNEKLQITEPDALDLYIERLVWFESNGKENIQIIDSNGKWSRGCLQYQDATFQAFSKKYGITGSQMDCEVQKRLTRAILLNEKNGYRHWYTSTVKRGLGMPPV